MNEEVRAGGILEKEFKAWNDHDYMVRLYLNRWGLKHALRDHGSAFTAGEPENLMVNFANGGLNWDIIDCDSGAENADELIKNRNPSDEATATVD